MGETLLVLLRVAVSLGVVIALIASPHSWCHG